MLVLYIHYNYLFLLNNFLLHQFLNATKKFYTLV